jgi:hypothetical protein
MALRVKGKGERGTTAYLASIESQCGIETVHLAPSAFYPEGGIRMGSLAVGAREMHCKSKRFRQDRGRKGFRGLEPFASTVWQSDKERLARGP